MAKVLVFKYKNTCNQPPIIYPPVDIHAKHQTLVSLLNRKVRRSYYMGLNAMDMCYNSI
jgi:hypothetical protein